MGGLNFIAAPSKVAIFFWELHSEQPAAAVKLLRLETLSKLKTKEAINDFTILLPSRTCRCFVCCFSGSSSSPTKSQLA